MAYKSGRQTIAAVRTHKSMFILLRSFFPLDRKQLQSKPNVETFFDNTLNWEQQRAVQNVVSSDNLKTVHIIFGPPGTGKTTTVVEIARQLMQNPELRILLTAPSNQACDILTTRLASVISGEKRDAYRLNVHKTLFRLNGKIKILLDFLLIIFFFFHISAYTRTLSEVPDTVRPHTKAKYSITDNSFEYYDIPSMEDLKTYRYTCRIKIFLLTSFFFFFFFGGYVG